MLKLILTTFNNGLIIQFGRATAQRTITFPIAYNKRPVVNAGDEHGGSAHFSALSITKTSFYLSAKTENGVTHADNGNWISI